MIISDFELQPSIVLIKEEIKGAGENSMLVPPEVVNKRMYSFFIHRIIPNFILFETLKSSSWVNILPKNPYLAKRVVLKNLNLLKSKNDDFWEHLPNC